MSVDLAGVFPTLTGDRELKISIFNSERTQKMKRFNFFTMVFFFSIVSASVFADPDPTATPGVISLGSLIQQEANTVNSFDGFVFNAMIVDNLPVFSISYFQLNNKATNDANTKLLFFDQAGVSKADQDAVVAQISAFQNFQPVTVLYAGTDEENGMKLLRFDSLDDQNVVRESEWRDAKTGFLQKHAFFDSTGNLIYTKFYTKVRFNPPSAQLNLPQQASSDTIQHLSSKHHGYVLTQIGDLEAFGNLVLDDLL